MPVTPPLCESADTKRCLDDFAQSGADNVVTVNEAHRSPYFNMVKHKRTAQWVLSFHRTVICRGAVAFLAGDMSAYVTGQNLSIVSGWGVW